MKTFNEHQMRDPWGWCVGVIEKHELTSTLVADNLDIPRSTLRALWNGTHRNPRYELLTKLIDVCIQIENGVDVFGEKEKVASKRPKDEAPQWDFL